MFIRWFSRSNNPPEIFKCDIDDVAHAAIWLEEFRKILTLKWVQDYCKENNLPLLLPLVPNKALLTENTEKIYLAELLDGLNFFQKAIKIKDKLKLVSNSNANITYLNELYSTYLTIACGKDNFFAEYLTFYEKLSTEMHEKDLETCISDYKEIKKDLNKLIGRYGIPAHYYAAELHFLFANLLSQKVSNIKNNPDVQNIGNHSILGCLKAADAALNFFWLQVNQNKLGTFTLSQMHCFSGRIKEVSPEERTKFLRAEIEKIRKKIHAQILPQVSSKPKECKEHKDGVPVGLDKLPWPEQVSSTSVDADALKDSEKADLLSSPTVASGSTHSLSPLEAEELDTSKFEDTTTLKPDEAIDPIKSEDGSAEIKEIASPKTEALNSSSPVERKEEELKDKEKIKDSPVINMNPLADAIAKRAKDMEEQRAKRTSIEIPKEVPREDHKEVTLVSTTSTLFSTKTTNRKPIQKTRNVPVLENLEDELRAALEKRRKNLGEKLDETRVAKPY